MPDFENYADELLCQADALFQAGLDERGQCTVLAYSRPLAERLRRVEKSMQELGMQTSWDPVGNLTGLLPGRDSRRRLMMASHLDTVIHAGRYDGVFGVLLGLAVVHYLRDHNMTLQHDLEVRAFMGEESPGVTATFGSRAATGCYDMRTLKKMSLAWQPETLVPAAINRFFHEYLGKPFPPFDQGQLQAAQLDRKQYLAALEVHIEQFTLLRELAGTTGGQPWTGVMRGVGGHLRTSFKIHDEKNHQEASFSKGFRVTFAGGGGHSGATPMEEHFRDDALVHAAQFLKAMESWLASGDTSLTQLEVQPCSMTTIPEQVILTLGAPQEKAQAVLAAMTACKSEKTKIEELSAEMTAKPFAASVVKALSALVLSARSAALQAEPAAEIRSTITKVNPGEDGGLSVASDIRGADSEAMKQVLAEICNAAGNAGAHIENRRLSEQKPVLFEPMLTQKVAAELKQAFDGRVMDERISVPGQDIGNVAACSIPSVLLFIESGTGHHPGEYVRREAAVQAVEAAVRLVRFLDEGEPDE